MTEQMESVIRAEQVRVYGREFPDTIEKLRCCDICPARYLEAHRGMQPVAPRPQELPAHTPEKED